MTRHLYSPRSSNLLGCPNRERFKGRPLDILLRTSGLLPHGLCHSRTCGQTHSGLYNKTGTRTMCDFDLLVGTVVKSHVLSVGQPSALIWPTAVGKLGECPGSFE